MRKVKFFSSVLAISAALLLMPVAQVNARTAVDRQSMTVFQAINRSSDPITINSSQEYDCFKLDVVSTTITPDEDGLNIEIIFSYEFNDGVYGFASIIILPNGSVTADSSFDLFMAEVQSRSDEDIAPEVTIVNLLNFSTVPNGKLGDITVNDIWNCIKTFHFEISLKPDENGKREFKVEIGCDWDKKETSQPES